MQDALAMDNEISGQEQENDVVAKLKMAVHAKRIALEIEKEMTGRGRISALWSKNGGASRLLKQSWFNLITSFGLTLIYINIHVFLSIVFGGKIFCKLGREWLPWQVAAINPEVAERTGAKIAIIEWMGLMFLNLIALFLVLMIISFVAIVADIYANPLSNLRIVFKVLYEMLFALK